MQVTLVKLVILFYIASVNSQTFSHPKIDSKELKCLVCQATIEEFDGVYGKLDPQKTVSIGGYQLDPKGNMKQKSVQQSQSETYLHELLEKICDKMDDYIRATYKTTGKLTLLKLIGGDGKMNPDMSEVDIVQDDDLNKSLKYYCESILEEYDESIVKHFINKSTNIDIRVCSEEAGFCPYANPDESDDTRDEL